MIEETKITPEAKKLADSFRAPPHNEAGLLEACSDNVVLFAEKMLGIERLYTWQVLFLRRMQDSINGKTDSKEVAAITSRQIGKSLSVSILALWVAVFNKQPHGVSKTSSIGIISASDTQAKKLLNEMKKLLRIGDRHMKTKYKDEEDEPLFGEHFFTDLLDPQEANNTTTITLLPYDEDQHGDYLLKGASVGSTIKSYPPTAVVLGETFSLIIIDEAGKTERITDQFFYDYIQPTGDSTNALYVYTSTPWVSSGFFYRIIDPDEMFADTGVEKLLFTIDAIEEEGKEQYSKVKKRINALNEDGKIDEVQRAYYCRFVKGQKSYFNPKKVMDVFTEDYQKLYEYDKPCDMGVDFGGQVTSRTVITISELMDNGTARRLYHQVYEPGQDTKLIQDMEDLMKRFNIQRIIPDDCPAGWFFIQQMKDKGWNVQPMSFRTDKVKKYGGFRSMIERNNGPFVVSYEDPDLKIEMLSLEQSETSKQSKIQHAPGYTDDLIDSFVMSCYFFIEEESGFKLFDYYGEDNE